MLESSLLSQEIFNRQFFLWFIGQDPFTMIHLKQRPITGFHCQLADLHYIGHLITPASRTRCHYIKETCSFCINSLFRLSVNILKISSQRCLRHIRHIMNQLFAENQKLNQKFQKLKGGRS